jgi:hypothetical protein
MAYAQRKMLLAPSAAYILLAGCLDFPRTRGERTNGMQITSANSTSLDFDIDIIISKRLGRELVLMKLGPFLRVFDLKSYESLGVHHCL